MKNYYFAYLIAIVCSHIMCIIVSYNYGVLSYNVATSFPPYIAFFYAIPFLLIISTLCLIGYFLQRKSKK